jgi:hypothetical protein
MQTRIDEIAAGIYRLSVYVPDIAPPVGFTFNHFLVRAAEPMLFHCGLRAMFPTLSEAVGRLIPIETLRWIGFGHVEGRRMRRDECVARRGAARAGRARRDRVHGLGQRPRRPRAAHAADGEVLDLGGRRVRYIDTPHVPHGWEAGVLYEETTATCCAATCSPISATAWPVTDKDIVGPAIEAERLFHYTSLGPSTAPNIRKLAALAPRTLGGDARRLVSRQRRPGAACARPTTMTPSFAPRCWRARA